MKIQKKNGGGGVGGRGEGSGWEGGPGGCDRRIEVFGKIHTKKFGGGCRVGGGGFRVDVREELKFLEKFTKKKSGGGGGGRVGGGGGGGGSGWM